MKLPEGWKLEAIKNCCTVVSGSTPRRNKSEYWENGCIPWVTPKDLSRLNSPILEDTPEKITKLGYDSCSTTLLPKGSILFSSRAPIGHVAIAGKEMCTNQGFKSLIPNDSVNSNYLYWCMRQYAKNIESLGSGSTFKEVSKGIVEKFKIPLPPIAQQRRIACILDKADEIRRKRQEAIKLTEELGRSLFLDMFGDPVTNPNGWKIVKLGQVAEKEKGAIKCGPFGSQLLISEFVDEGIPVYGIDNVQKNEFIWAKPKFITENKYQQLKAFSIKSGDVLISRTGTVGRTCIAPSKIPKSIIGPNLLKVSLNHSKILSKYLSCALCYSDSLLQQIKQMSPGATVPVFNTTNLKSLKLANPPIEMQLKFNDFIGKIEQQIIKEKAILQDSENLFHSLLQKAFKGEL